MTSDENLFLKNHRLLKFTTAIINNFGRFYSTEFYIHEARRWGAQVEASEINYAAYFTQIKGKTIYLDWVHIKSLERETADAILSERERGREHLHFDDFYHRLQPGLEQLII